MTLYTTGTTSITPVNTVTAYIKFWEAIFRFRLVLLHIAHWHSERRSISASQQLPHCKALKTNFMFTHEGVMCKLARGNANESQVPLGGHSRSPRGVGGMGDFGGRVQPAARTSFWIRFLFALAEESCGSSWCFRLFPPSGDSLWPDLFMEGCNIIGLHQLISASGHKLGHRAAPAGRIRCILPNGTHTVGCEGLLDVLSAAAGRIMIKAFWFAEKGNFSN